MKDKIASILVKHQTIFWFGLTAVLCGSLVIFVITPQLQDYLNTRRDIEGKLSRTNLINEKANKLQQVDLPLYRQKLNTALLALPQGVDLIPVLNLSQLLVVNNGLELQDISFSGLNNPKTATSDSKSYQVNLEVSGDTASLQKFLINIQKIPRILKIVSLEVTSTRQNERFRAGLGLEAFYSSLPSALTSSVEEDIKLLDEKEENLLSAFDSSTFPLLAPSLEASSPRGKTNPFE